MTGGSTLRTSTSWMGVGSTTNNAPRSKTLGRSAAERPQRRNLATLLFSPPPSEEDLHLQRAQIDNDDDDGALNNDIGANSVASSWNVTLVDKGRSKRTQHLIVYVSTPTASLTLMRTAAQIRQLEADLLNDTSDSYLPFDARRPAAPPNAKPRGRKRSAMLASLQRTLSPRRHGHRSTLSNFSAFATSAAEPSSAPLEDLAATAQRLTALSSDPSVRNHPSWGHFFTPSGKDDLHSRRVEQKRLKRTISDQTMHLRNPAANEGRQATSSDAGSGNVTADVVDVGFFNAVAADRLQRSNGFDRRETSAASTALTASSDALSSLPPPTPPIDTIGSVVADHVGMDVSPKPSIAGTASPPDSRSRTQSSTKSPRVTIDSFEIMRVLGKGCAGKVLLVKEKASGELYALKAITKQHVLAHRELAHTRTEQTVLKACSRDPTLNPFIVKLHYSFHDRDTLYLALDFHPGGDLATQLARWGRLGRDRTRFYLVEMVIGLRGLHQAGIIYRDLKPENILISAEGHIVLTDFGLSKDFGHTTSRHTYDRRSASTSITGATGTSLDAPRPHWLSSESASVGPTRSVSMPPSTWAGLRRETTTTFCGTAEYLAPELLLGEPYSYEVDAWALGTIAYECLCGVTPFYSEDHSKMYRQVLHDELDFHESRVFDNETKSFIRGCLQRDPLLRMSDERIMRHAYFDQITWEFVAGKRYAPPFKPTLNPDDPTDTSMFDDAFLAMDPSLPAAAAAAVKVEKGLETEGQEDMAKEMDAAEVQPQARFDSSGQDVFDGYSYYGRDSASLRRFASDEEPEDDALSDVENDDERGNAHGPESFAPDATVTVHVSKTRTLTQQKHQGADAPSELDDWLNAHPSPDVGTIYRRSLTEPEDVVVEANEEGVINAGDLDDGDWDALEAESGASTPTLPTARNGGREATFFARGFRDKYRLVVSSPRPSLSRRTSSSRRASSTMTSSSTVGEHSTPSSPMFTPDVPTRKLRRIASVRSTGSSSNVPDGSSVRGLGIRHSHLSLRPEDAENVSVNSTLRGSQNKMAAQTDCGENEDKDEAVATPRRGSLIKKRLTLSAFRTNTKAA